MKQVIFLLVSIILLCSCHKDDGEKNDFDTSVLYGEWYSNVDGIVTDLSLSSMTLAGNVYKTEGAEMVLYEKWTGSWLYYSENKILSMSIYYSSTHNQTLHNYQIVKVDDYTLILRDQNLGTVDSYNKVIESKKLGINEEYDIGYLKTHTITATSYISSNPSIASVDNNGHVKAKKAGAAFISISSNVGTLIVKVEVQ